MSDMVYEEAGSRKSSLWVIAKARDMSYTYRIHMNSQAFIGKTITKPFARVAIFAFLANARLS